MLIKRDMLFTPKNKNRPLHIWLPEGYDNSTDRYPVMYFFDGHNLFTDADATFGKCWGLLDFLQSWEKPLIVVGIECGHEGNERLYEYCPYHFRGKFWGDRRTQTSDRPGIPYIPRPGGHGHRRVLHGRAHEPVRRREI